MKTIQKTLFVLCGTLMFACGMNTPAAQQGSNEESDAGRATQDAGHLVLVCEPDQIPFMNTATGEIGCKDRVIPDAGSNTPDAAHVEPDAGNAADAGTQDSGSPSTSPHCAEYDGFTPGGFVWFPVATTLEYPDDRTDATVMEFVIFACHDVSIYGLYLDGFNWDEEQQNPQAPDDPTGFMLANNVPAFSNPRILDFNGNEVEGTSTSINPRDGELQIQIFPRNPIIQAGNSGWRYRVLLDISQNRLLTGTQQHFEFNMGFIYTNESCPNGCGANSFPDSSGFPQLIVNYGEAPDAGVQQMVPDAGTQMDAGIFGLSIFALPDDGSGVKAPGNHVNAENIRIETQDHGFEIKRLGFLVTDENNQWLQAGDIPAGNITVTFEKDGVNEVVDEIDGRSNWLYGDNTHCFTSWGMITAACQGYFDPHYLSGNYPVIPAHSQAFLHMNMDINWNACARNGYTLHFTGITTQDVVTGEVRTESFVPTTFSGAPMTVQSNLQTDQFCRNSASTYFSMGLDETTPPQNGVHYQIGNCVVHIDTGAALDEDCSDNSATLNGTQTDILHDQLTALTGMTDPNFGPLTTQRATTGLYVIAHTPVIHDTPHITFGYFPNGSTGPFPNMAFAYCK